MYIDRIGIEMEGGWNRRPLGTMHNDASVSVSARFTGEVVSEPFKCINRLFAFMNKNYPQVVNSTCGLHIHISLKNEMLYSRLMEEEFYSFFLNEVEKWAGKNEPLLPREFYSRLNGENRYCQKKFLADKQATLNEKHSARYCHLNYCYTLRRTLEIRLFPMFKELNLSIAVIQLTINIINKWLSSYDKIEMFEIEINDDIMINEVTEMVI